MRNLFPINNDTSKIIECYNDDSNEKETFNQCQRCSLALNSTSTIRSCSEAITTIGVSLHEKTTLDDKREFKTVSIDCVQSHCNTKETAQEALRILAETGFAQHLYDLSSSATVLEYSITCMLVYMFILLNII